MSEKEDDLSSFSPVRIGIVVGETSGDILGAGLVAELQRRFPQCRFEGVGGPRMMALGFHSLFNMDRLAVMGLVEPLKRLPELLSIRKSLRKYFLANPPDIFIGIDAPDFNLTLEEKLRAGGIATAHYVSPSVWAWRQGRVKKIARAVDLMLTLFPFEEKFYRDHQVRVTCVGHTLADQIPLVTNKVDAQKSLNLCVSSGSKVVAILPGSRASEVANLADTFFKAAEICAAKIPNLQFVVAAANEQRQQQINTVLKRFPRLAVRVVLKHSHEVMAASDVVLMASGTTTLEALLLKKPMVIAYRMAWFSWQILKRLVQSRYVGLPNLLAERSLVPELLQDEATPENIAEQVFTFIENEKAVGGMLMAFDDIHQNLQRNADSAAADALCDLLKERASDA